MSEVIDVEAKKVEVAQGEEGITKEQLERSKVLSGDLQEALSKLGIKAFVGLFVCDDNATRVYYHQVGADLAQGFALKIIKDIGAAKEREKHDLPKSNQSDRAGKEEDI